MEVKGIDMKTNKKGFSLIAGVVTIAIVIASSVIVINIINPTIERGKEYQNVNKAKQTMSIIDSAIREMAYEAPGSRKTINIASDGDLVVSEKDSTIKMKIEGTKIADGARVKEGNLIISSGALVLTYEKDIDGDGNNDLVMENDAMIIAFKKIGTPTLHAAINTSNIVVLIQNKIANRTIVPRTGLYINDQLNTSFGIGYTEFVSSGGQTTVAAVRLYMNSTAGTQYDAIFTLNAVSDFIEMDVRNIV